VLGRAVRSAGDCTGAAARGGGVQEGLTESRRPQRGPHHSTVATQVETDRPCNTAAPSFEVIKRATPRSVQCPLGTAASLSGERLGRSAVRIQVLVHLSGLAHGAHPTPPSSPLPAARAAQAAPQRWGQPEPEGLPPHGASYVHASGAEAAELGIGQPPGSLMIFTNQHLRPKPILKLPSCLSLGTKQQSRLT
jgi:hypothetical protein